MDDTQAHKIISALADGCNPTTGEKVEGSVLQHSDVIRALHLAVRALETNTRSKARSSRARVPANAGKPWTGLYVVEDDAISLVDLGELDAASFGVLMHTQGQLWSIGEKDVIAYDGSNWSRLPDMSRLCE